MSMRWENHMDLEGIAIMVRAHVEDGLEAGAEIIRTLSDALVPFEVGTLASTVKIKESRGGLNTIAITYDGPYARYQHDNLEFKHAPGRVAKYLELAMIEKGEASINKAGDYIWDKVTARTWGSM